MENRNRSGRDGNAEDEVQRLFRKNNGRISQSDFARLRHKYDNDQLVDKIQKLYLEKHHAITKKAKKFAQLIREKYSSEEYPFHLLLEKARLYKVKYSLSDDEFNEFQRIYEQELVGMKSPEVINPQTNMSKFLGNINVDIQGFNQNLNDADMKTLQEILKLHSSSRSLHAQVLVQSLQYSDCDYEAINGEYKKEHGNRPGDSIHPVIAALFLPKIDCLDSHFLQSNISAIVASRYRREALFTKQDYELFYSLINDPNDVVCDNRSAITDLHNRAQLQNQLWNCVLRLRSGQYYGDSLRDFIGSVDMCKLNRQDNPDLVYGRYDGTVLKRLLSAFSYRPTIVSTTPFYPTVSVNPYQLNVRPVVTSVPMINMRMPLSVNDNSAINLEDAINQDQYFLENGAIVPRNTSLIYSRGVLFFFIDRRSQVIRLNNEMQPFNLARLPIALSGFERLNDREVNFSPNFQVGSDNYRLRSVVVSEVNRNAQERNLVIGSSALIVSSDGTNHLKYDPSGVISRINLNGQIQAAPPIYPIPELPQGGQNAGISFNEIASNRGIIFMYQLVSDARDEMPIN
jgi:hypothetical protein